MEPLRLGVLSTARINDHVLAGAAESDAVDVVAVGSRDAARARDYARERGIPRAHGSYDELLTDDEVEAVYISLPNSLHVPWSVRALEAGKHVLCEKPLARSAAEVERAFDAAERAGRILMEAFMYRHHPQTARIAELVQSGALGRVRSLRALFTFDLLAERPDSDIRLDGALEGGVLMDLGCYCVSAMRLLAGEPERFHAELERFRGGVDLTFHGLLGFAGEVAGEFVASFALPARQELEVIGSDGTLVVRSPFRTDWGGPAELRRGDAVETIALPEVSAYRLELEDLAAAVRGLRAPLLGRADAVGQARAIERLYAAASP
jgi:D-xylose 1-dehydrogenase (NADP+, D-xylono-1,5-lactone-forming)